METSPRTKSLKAYADLQNEPMAQAQEFRDLWVGGVQRVEVFVSPEVEGHMAVSAAQVIVGLAPPARQELVADQDKTLPA